MKCFRATYKAVRSWRWFGMWWKPCTLFSLFQWKLILKNHLPCDLFLWKLLLKKNYLPRMVSRGLVSFTLILGSDLGLHSVPHELSQLSRLACDSAESECQTESPSGPIIMGLGRVLYDSVELHRTQKSPMLQFQVTYDSTQPWPTPSRLGLAEL